MTTLLDGLGVAARVEGGRFEPGLIEADTVALATSDDERVVTTGGGETVETEAATVARGLEALAVAAIRFGPVEEVTWHVDGRTLLLSPITESAAPVVLGDEVRDFGALVARIVIEQLGGSLALDGETLRGPALSAAAVDGAPRRRRNVSRSVIPAAASASPIV